MHNWRNLVTRRANKLRWMKIRRISKERTVYLHIATIKSLSIISCSQIKRVHISKIYSVLLKAMTLPSSMLTLIKIFTRIIGVIKFLSGTMIASLLPPNRASTSYPNSKILRFNKSCKCTEIWLEIIIYAHSSKGKKEIYSEVCYRATIVNKLKWISEVSAVWGRDRTFRKTSKFCKPMMILKVTLTRLYHP